MSRRTVEQEAWRNMIQRCTNKLAPNYAYYGKRGIRVCQRWRRSYAAFLADMGYRPSAGHSLDRIDNNGNYEPGNCRWATRTEQALNRRPRGGWKLIGTKRVSHTVSQTRYKTWSNLAQPDTHQVPSPKLPTPTRNPAKPTV